MSVVSRFKNRSFRFRLLPLTLVAIVSLLGMRVIEAWTLVSQTAGTVFVSQSVAETTDKPAPVVDAHDTDKKTEKTDAAVTPPPPSFSQGGAASEGEMVVLEALRQRREELDVRARELDQREIRLTAAEQSLDQKMAEMQTLRKDLEGLLGKVDEQQQAQLDKLVKVYETMKPKDAASIFANLDMPVLLSVLDRMKEQKAALILAALEPARAQEITTLLADRRRLPTLPDAP